MTYLVESVQTESKTLLYRFYKDSDNKKQVEIIRNFRPYFYVQEDCDIPSDNRITHVESGYTSIFGEKLVRIYVMKSVDVREVRELFPKHYEADILFPQRYIIDEIGEAEVYPLHTLALDIETDDSSGFPDCTDPRVPILSCSFCDDKFKKKQFVYLSPDFKGEYVANEYTSIVNTEEELLQNIVRYVKEEDPDVITGWNVIGFDLSYLIARMNRLEVEYKKLSPLGFVNVNPERQEVQIKGRIVLDGLAAYSHFRKISNQGKAESYSLEFTAQDILGVGKIQHKEKIIDMWKNNPTKLVEYNMRDSELVIGILNKLEIVDFFNYLRSKSCAQMNQIYQTTSLVDGFLLRRSHDIMVMPSRNKRTEMKYPGAFVFPPKPGLYENVFVFDVKGMYPNIIKTFNMSPETFNPKGEIKIKAGIGFDKGIGLMSGIMRELEKERNMFKKLKAKAIDEKDDTGKKVNHYKQYSVKVLMNSFYGYLGYPGSRLYKKEIATAITETGQDLIKWIATYVEQLGYKILYGDTDSVYIQANNKDLIKLIKEGRKLIGDINKSFVDFSKQYNSDDCTLEMDFEKIFKKLLFVGKKDDDENGAKKKYAYIALWNSDGGTKENVQFTGFDTVRSDSPRLARSTQKEVIRMILNDYKKEDIIQYITNLEKDVKNGKISIEDISFPRGISGKLADYGLVKKEEGKKARKGSVPPVIAGARYSNKYLGTQMGQGSKPKWIYIKKVPPGYPDTRVLSFEEDIPKGFIPDYELMVEKLFKSKLEAIFIASGFGEFPNINHNVKKLSDFEVPA